jgi:hypothetical protein
LYDDIKVAGVQALYDDVIKTTTVPAAAGNDEYDDIIKGSEKPSSGAAAKPNTNDVFDEGEQPFDSEVYSAPYSTPN